MPVWEMRSYYIEAVNRARHAQPPRPHWKVQCAPRAVFFSFGLGPTLGLAACGRRICKGKTQSMVEEVGTQVRTPREHELLARRWPWLRGVLVTLAQQTAGVREGVEKQEAQNIVEKVWIGGVTAEGEPDEDSLSAQ